MHSPGMLFWHGEGGMKEGGGGGEEERKDGMERREKMEEVMRSQLKIKLDLLRI